MQTESLKKLQSENVPDASSRNTKTPNDFSEEISKLISTAGTLELTTEEKEILYSSPEDTSIEIRPDGLIYCPWMIYARKMNQVFGTAWTLIPQGTPKIMGETIFWGFHLLARGKYCGYAIGEQKYDPSNRTMSFGDACEGAKSNAITRLCKQMGVFNDLWNPSFIKSWKEKYARIINQKWVKIKC